MKQSQQSPHRWVSSVKKQELRKVLARIRKDGIPLAVHERDRVGHPGESFLPRRQASDETAPFARQDIPGQSGTVRTDRAHVSSRIK